MERLGSIIKKALLILVVVLAFYLIPTRNLYVKPAYQYPNMPNGCEITSLEMLMRYNGFDVSKEFLNDNFLKHSSMSNADPDLAYIGSPYGKSSGYYSYAAPIAEAANKYFESNNVSIKAKDKTGMTVFGVLNQIIFKKKPVAVWYTVDDEKPRYNGTYYTSPSREKEPLYANLHCVVVDGVSKGMISIVDPEKGRREINFIEFTKLYMQMGQRAVVI